MSQISDANILREMKILYQVKVHLFHQINMLQKLFNKDKILIQEFKVAFLMQSSRRLVIVYLHEDALIMAGSPPFFQGPLQTAHTQHSPLSAIFPFSSFFVAVSTIQGKPVSSDGTIHLQKKTQSFHCQLFSSFKTYGYIKPNAICPRIKMISQTYLYLEFIYSQILELFFTDRKIKMLLS